MKDKFAVDSNIIIYSLNRDAGRKHEAALNFLSKAENMDAAIPLQCLAETYFQITKRKVSTEKGRKAVESLKHDTDFQIINYGIKELDEAVKTDRNFWDRLIEATLLENGYKTIYTENINDFQEIETINPLKP